MRFFLLLSALLSFSLLSVAQQDCRSVEYKQEMIRTNPELAVKIQQIEGFTRQRLQSFTVEVTGTEPAGKGVGVIRVPVVVDIVSNSSRQNINDAHGQSHIAFLHHDFPNRTPYA